MSAAFDVETTALFVVVEAEVSEVDIEDSVAASFIDEVAVCGDAVIFVKPGTAFFDLAAAAVSTLSVAWAASVDELSAEDFTATTGFGRVRPLLAVVNARVGRMGSKTILVGMTISVEGWRMSKGFFRLPAVESGPVSELSKSKHPLQQGL